MIDALSGPDAADTAAQVRGVKAAASVLNAQGGILGHKIQVTVRNDQGSATTAVTELQAALSGGAKPDFVWPGATSDEAQALAPILTKDKILANGVIGSPSIVNPSSHPYFFSVSGSPAAAAAAEATYLKKQNAKRVVELYENNVLGVEIQKAEVSAFKKAGFTVKAIPFGPTAVNVVPELQKAQAFNPDHVVYEALGSAAAHVLAARATLGWNVPVLGDEVVGGTFNMSTVPANQRKGVTVQVENLEVYKPPAQRKSNFATFLSALKKQGKVTQILADYAAGYDAIMLADDGAVKAKSISAPDVAKAMQELGSPAKPNYVTFPSYGYTANDHFPAVAPTKSQFRYVPMQGPVGGMFHGSSGS